MSICKNVSTVQAKLDMIGCGNLFDAAAVKQQEEAYFKKLVEEDKEATKKEVEAIKKMRGETDETDSETETEE